ncbi:hypothetical protein ACWEQ4_01175 [Rhodococcus sp. NPDC003994]
MGKPLSDAHKAAISKALRERSAGAPRKTRAERRAARTPEQVAASKERRAARRVEKKNAAAAAKAAPPAARRRSTPPTNADGSRQSPAERRAKRGPEAQTAVSQLKAEGGHGRSSRTAADNRRYGLGTASARRWKAEEKDGWAIKRADKQIAANVQGRKDRVKVAGPDHVEKRRKLAAAEERKRRYGGRRNGEREFVRFMRTGRL